MANTQSRTAAPKQERTCKINVCMKWSPLSQQQPNLKGKRICILGCSILSRVRRRFQMRALLKPPGAGSDIDYFHYHHLTFWWQQPIVYRFASLIKYSRKSQNRTHKACTRPHALPGSLTTTRAKIDNIDWFLYATTKIAKYRTALVSKIIRA